MTHAKWQPKIYSTCKRFTLGSTSQNVGIDMRPMAAKCLAVYTDGTGQKSIQITAKGDVNLLPHLTIATENGKQFVEAVMMPAGSPNRAVFNFTIGGGSPEYTYFIIANAATNPRHNSGQAIELAVSLAQTNATSAKPTQKQRARSKKQKRKDTSDKAFADEYAENKGNDTWQGRVTQMREGRTCEKAFVDRICGEHTKISLALTPDQVTAIQSSIKSASILDVTRRVSEIGDAKEISDLLLHQRRLEEIEGSSISIQIPRISYGFTGSFANAGISMGGYNSRGPIWVGSCRKGYHAYSGQVTIEEASKEVLRGRFAAQMVNSSLRSKYYCRDLPVYKSISGSFIIHSPELERSTQEIDIDSEKVIDRVIDDVASVVPGLVTPEMRENLREKAREKDAERQREWRSRENSPAVVNEACDCRCDRAGQTITRMGCYQYCEAEYKQCKIPSFEQIELMYDVTHSNTTEEAQAADQMRKEIIVWLANEKKQYVRDSYIKLYDDMPRTMKSKIYADIKEKYARQ